MELRLANEADLQSLKTMYGKIIENMNKNGIDIWDEIYPCEFFQDDITNRRLYVLTKDTAIISAFALCESNDGASHVQWENNNAAALYLDRLGVNVDYLRQGIGGLTLKKAAEIAKAQNADYLRLFVVDINQPAIDLYLKSGFHQADGIYAEKIDEEFVLYEYGLEINVTHCF